MSPILPQLPLVDGAFFIDNSQIEKYQTCPRMWQYYALHKRESAGDASALVFGRALHKALDMRYSIAHEVPNGVSATSHETENAQCVEAQRIMSEIEVDPEDHRTTSRVAEVIELYNKHYKDEFQSLSVLKSEFPIAVKLGEVKIPYSRTSFFPNNIGWEITEQQFIKVPIIWTGRVDLAVLLQNDTRPWIVDHKTTSIWGESYVSGMRLRGQFRGYCWAFREMFPNHEQPAGAMLNVLVIRKKTVKGTGVHTEFHRQMFSYTEDDLTEWRENTLALVQKMLESYYTGFLPQHTNQCIQYMRPCPYYEVCNMPRDQREFLLGTSSFKNVTWSPLENE